MGKHNFLTKDKIQSNPYLQKIDKSFLNCDAKKNNVVYYRVMDGVSPEITALLYDDLILNNFAEKERDTKGDFQAFFKKNPERDARRENINIIAVANSEFVGLLTGMAFHISQLGYFDYIVVKKSVRKKGIGRKLFHIGKQLLKTTAQEHGYDYDNLAVLLTVEKEDSTMNTDKGQDTEKRLNFYEHQNCKRIGGMPCIVPEICDSETKEQKEEIEEYDWLIAGVNRNFQDDEIIMDRETALKFNIDNIDLQYTNPEGRPAQETETYKKIEKSLGNKIFAENIFKK